MAIARLVSEGLDLPAGREVRSVQALDALQRPIGDGLLIAVSHEGGTHVTNEAISAAQAVGATTALITVGPGSPGAALAGHVILTGAGPELVPHHRLPGAARRGRRAGREAAGPGSTRPRSEPSWTSARTLTAQPRSRRRWQEPIG